MAEKVGDVIVNVKTNNSTPDGMAIKIGRLEIKDGKILIDGVEQRKVIEFTLTAGVGKVALFAMTQIVGIGMGNGH